MLEQQWNDSHSPSHLEGHSYSKITFLRRWAQASASEDRGEIRVFSIDANAHNAVAAFDRTLWESGLSAAMETAFRLMSRQNSELHKRLELAEATIGRLQESVEILLLSKAPTVVDPVATPDYEFILNVAQSVAGEVGLVVERWVAHPEQSHVEFEVAEPNADSAVELMWEFNRRIADSLPSGYLTAVTFDMTVLED